MRTEATVRAEVREIVTPTGEDYFAFPLTLVQAAMWPRDLPSSSDPRFNGAFRMSLEGRVDASLLEQSFQEIAQRHEILRANFRIVDGDVRQVIFPSSNLTVDTLDLRLLPADERMAELDEICLREARTGFDLTKGTPIRVRLLCLEDEHFILTLTIHQIICDGWSIGLLMEELADIYSAFARRQPSPLLPLDFQYGDYVMWQREPSLLAEAQTQLEFWKKKLAGCRQLRVTPDVVTAFGTNDSGIASQLLSRELTDRLRGLSQAQNTTFFVVTMAACMVLLNRYTGETDVALRTPLAGRSRVEFEGIIGQFVNHVVIRSDVSGDITVSDFVARVRESVWEALANRDAPFEQVVQEVAGLNPSTDGSFGINFVCQREYGRSGPFQFEFDGIRMTTLPSKSQGALYDLNFFLVEREVGWRLSLEYKTEFYTQSRAESLLQHFQKILQEITANPQRRLSELTLPMEALGKRMELNLSSSAPADIVSEGSQALMEMQAMPGSLAQERFWALSQIDPSNPTFHIPVTMTLTGQLSELLLEKSFQLLVDRHEMLRTTFSETDGEFMQVIHAAQPFTLASTTFEDLGVDERASRLEAVVQEEVATPFDLSSLPLFRALLCRIASQEHVLIITIHRILADAWSVQVFQRELWSAYESLQLGKDVSFAPLVLQYADFSVWQREGLDSDSMTGHLDYWLKKLSGDIPALNFPTDHAPAYRPASQGAIQTLLLPDDLSRSLKQLAQTSDVTLFVLTLACFALVLGRASNAEDLIVGSPVANRRMETEPLIGPFAGPVALRLSLKGNPTLRDFILTARDTTLDALCHADLPFEVLLEKLRVRPWGGRNPLFQFYFFCQPAFFQSRELPGLTVTPFPTMSLGIPFELQLGVIERAEGIRAELEYNSHLFKGSTVDAWLDYYQTVLTSLVSNPDQRVSDLPQPPSKASFTIESTRGAVQAPTNSEAVWDTLTTELVDIWEVALNIQGIGPYDDFFAIGGRSLSAARLMTKINKKYSLKLGLATMFSCPTVEELAKLIRGQLNPQAPSSIVPIQPLGTAAPLFVIHGVGGNVLNFYDLAKELGLNQPVYGVEAQALQVTDTPLTTLEDLATYYVSEVRKTQPFGPYHFLGYSYGGFVVFEMARQLQSANEKVALLGMLDTPIWRHELREARGTLAKIGRQLLAVWTPFFQRLRPCTPMEIFDGVKSTLLRSFYTLVISRGIHIPRLLRSVYHINSFAAVNYIPKKYDGKITMLRASAERGPRDLGWDKFTTQAVEVHEIPGAHPRLLSDDNMPRVVETLRRCLATSS